MAIKGILYHILHFLALLTDSVGDSIQNLNLRHLQLMVLLLFLTIVMQLQHQKAVISLQLTHI